MSEKLVGSDTRSLPWLRKCGVCRKPSIWLTELLPVSWIRSYANTSCSSNAIGL